MRAMQPGSKVLVDKIKFCCSFRREDELSEILTSGDLDRRPYKFELMKEICGLATLE